MIIEFFPPGFGTATQASPSEVRVGATVFGEGAEPGFAPPNPSAWQPDHRPGWWARRLRGGG